MLPLYCWHTYGAVNSTHTECVAWKNNAYTLVLFNNLDFPINFHKIPSISRKSVSWSRGSADEETVRYDETNLRFSRLMRKRLARYVKYVAAA